MPKNNFLVFLDQETRLSKNSFENLLRLKDKNLVGTFKVKFNKNTFSSFSFSTFKNILPLFKHHNGSGAIFCSKYAFEKIKGFNEKITKGENHEFINRARKYAKYYFLRNYSITSSRRFERLGYFKTMLFWIKEYLMGNKDYPAIR